MSQTALTPEQNMAELSPTELQQPNLEKTQFDAMLMGFLMTSVILFGLNMSYLIYTWEQPGTQRMEPLAQALAVMELLTILLELRGFSLNRHQPSQAAEGVHSDSVTYV